MNRHRWLALAVVCVVVAGSWVGWTRLLATLKTPPACSSDSGLRYELALRTYSAVQFAHHEQRLCAAERAQRVDAVRALGAFGALGARALSLVVARDETLEREACDTLLGMGKAGLSALAANARREVARAALVSVGASAAAPLLEALEQDRIWSRDNDERPELWVADVLRRIDDPRATEALVDALQTNDPRVGNVVVELWERAGAGFVERVIDLEKRSPGGPIWSLDLLQKAGPLAVDTVSALLDAKQPQTTQAAFLLLEELPNPVVVEALLGKLGEVDAATGEDIVCWLTGGCNPWGLGETHYALPLPAASQRTREAAHGLLITAKPDSRGAVESLLVALGDPAALERARTQDSRDDPEDLERELEALAHFLTLDAETAATRLGFLKRRVEELGARGDRRAVPHLLRVLRRFENAPPPRSSAPEVEVAVIQALARLGDPRAVPYLLERLRRSVAGSPVDWRIVELHVAALEALGSIGDRRAVQPLIAFIDGGSNRRERALRSQAGLVADVLEALARIGDPRALDPLRARADVCPPEARIWVLGQLD